VGRAGREKEGKERKGKGGKEGSVELHQLLLSNLTTGVAYTHLL